MRRLMAGPVARLAGRVRTSVPRPQQTLVAITVEGFVSRLGFSMVGFALPLFALSLGMNVAEIGLLYALRTVATIATKPALAWVSDRVGHRRTLILAAILRSTIGLLIAFASEPWHLYAIRLLHGAMTGAREPSAAALIASHGDRRRMGAAFAAYATARDVGRSVGYAVAGLLIELTGGFRMAFVVAFLLSLVGLALIVRYVRDAPAGAQGRATDGPATYRPGGALYRALLRPAAFGLLVATSAEMVAGLLPILATEWAHLSAGEAGIAVSVSAVMILVAGPAFGWIADRRGYRLVLGLRSGANVAASITYAVAPTFAGFLLARVVDDTGKAAFRPAWGALLAGAADEAPAHRARVMTFMDTAYTLGEIGGPLLAGLLIATFGFPVMLAVRAALALSAEVYIARSRSIGAGDVPDLGRIGDLEPDRAAGGGGTERSR